MNLTLSVILIGAVIAQGLFAALVVALQASNRKANRYLSVLLLIFALWLCDTFFNVSGIYEQSPNFYFLPIYFSLAFGPLLYLYTLAVTQQQFHFEHKHLWHFIPVLFQALLYVFLQFKDYEFKRWFWFEVHRPFTYDLEFNLSLLSILIYAYLSIRLVLNYQTWIKSQFSEISKIHLNWLKTIQIILMLMAVFWLIDALLRELFIYYPNQPLSAIMLGVAMLVLAIGGLLQADLLDKGIVIEPLASPVETHPEEETIDPQLLDRIRSEMEDKEYYLHPNLSLKSFAQQLNLPTRQVSFLINKGLGIPFIDFVNGYRVAKVQQHIDQKDLAHLTLFGIALESGFSSKSTFNRVFKNLTGKSPSAYQKEE